ncbi:MAG: sulfatase-like hydrolase/transferase [Isosphaeraceae bacterium]
MRSDDRGPRIPAMLAAALAATLTLVACGPTRGGPPGASPPNLLIIVADDLSSLYLGSGGDRRGATPHLDALAERGVSFERAFCNAPLCTPSRQSFITGLLPHAVGVTRLESKLPENALTLGAWLARHGYRTAAFGKMHFNGPSHHGFQARLDLPDWAEHLRRHPPPGGDRRREWRPFVDPPAGWLNARCEDHGLPLAAMESTFMVDRAIAFMRQPRDRPFALVVSLYEPHAPFAFPREWKGRYLPRDFPAPRLTAGDRRDQPRLFRRLSDDDFRGVQAAYYTSLAFLDFLVGRLVVGLDDLGLGGETLVVFIGDNGYLLGQHGRLEKNCFYEPAVRVPLIFRRPGRLPAGRRLPDLAELVDLFPTVCGLLGVPSPPALHGLDLTPLIEGRPDARGRDAVFSEYPEAEEAMIRSSRYKLVVGSGRRQRRDHLETGSPLSGPYVRLHDLERDPGETIDLAGVPHLQPVRDDLLRTLHDRLVSTWTGPSPVPRGLAPLDAIFWCLRPRD